MQNNYHTRRATVALRKLSEKDVAFASLSLFCKHRDAEKDLVIPGAPLRKDGTPMSAPAWTDGKLIHYGPSYEEKFDLEEKMGVSAHEILHIALRHISRAKQLQKRFGPLYDNYLFNVATDAIINQTLLLAGRKLPRPCIVLTELLKEAFNEDVEPEEAISQWDSERLYIRLVNEGKKRQKAGGGGQSTPGGDGGDLEQLVKALKDYLEKNEFEEDFFPDSSSAGAGPQEDLEWQQRLAQAISQGRLANNGAGTGLGRIGHKLADLPKSRTPWEVILRSVVNKAVTRMPRPSVARPTRRFLGMEADALMRGTPRPVYEPGFVKQSKEPRVVVGVDVSGSISDPLLEQFAAEIAGIGRRTGAEIHVLVFDTQVLSHTKMEGQSYEDEITKIDFARGGGTCFVDVVNKAAELDPSIIVVLTDLCGPFGEQPGNIPVLWTIPDAEPPGAPPFGKVLSMAA